MLCDLQSLIYVILASSPTLSSLKDANELGLKSDIVEKPNQQYSIDDKAKTRSRELLKS